MQLIKTSPFDFEGKSYQIRVFSDGINFSVAGFLQDRKVTSTYGVDMITDTEFRKIHGNSARDRLIKNVEEDISEGHLAV